MHEQSETVEKDGKWVNVYGSKTPNAGKPLPKRYDFEQDDYRTVEEAVSAARRRSEREGKAGMKRAMGRPASGDRYERGGSR